MLAQTVSPLNEQQYNVEIRFYRAFGTIGSDGTGNDPDPTWQIKTANDTDSLANDLLNNSPGVDNNSYCYFLTTSVNDWHPVADALVAVHENNTTGRFDYEIMSYENDTNPRCIYDADPPGQSQINDDDNMAYLEGIHAFGDETVKGNYKTTIKDLSNGSKVQFRYIWRHTNGLRDSPLDFGEVSNCHTFTHSNSTINESGQSDKTYYKDDWNSAIHPAFTSSNDVTYIFHNDRRRRIQISSVDNFDVKYHLLLPDSGQNVLGIVKTFETSLDTTLMAGYYTLVVEGDEDDGFNTPTGSFEFEMQFSFPDLSSINYSNQIIYVDKTASGNGNGTSWTNAMDDLQLALNEATASSQIWVAKGIYYPSDCDDRSHSFSLPDGVEIYGGFEGNESSGFDLAQRNFTANKTLLSGAIGVPGDSLDNSYNVVIASFVGSTTLIDGFTVTEGNSTDLAGGLFGGAGMQVRNSDLKLKNMVFENNAAQRGAGVANIAYNMDCSPSYFNCDFIGNYSSSRGGAILNFGAFGAVRSLFDQCDVTSNYALNGGGVFDEMFTTQHFSNSTFRNCNFSLNSSSSGGAVYKLGQTNISFENCNFISNVASGGGGAIYNTTYYTEDKKTFVNCNFYDNRASNGAAMYNINSGGTRQDVVNCTFFSNSALNNGIIYNGNLTMTQEYINCIFWGNQSCGDNPSLYNFEANSTLRNCLVQELNCDSLVAINGSINCSGTMLFNQDPLFINAGKPGGTDNTMGTTDDGLRLQNGSPAVNQGTNDGITHISDLIGQKHINMPDMGAYEFPCSDIQDINSVPNIMAEYISKATTETLQAANVINPTSNVYYQAGEHILLSPGFEAKSGNVFEAGIGDGCL